MTGPHDPGDDKIDLSALNPDADGGAADRFVNAVMSRVESRPRPAALPADPLIGIWSVMRSPALAAGILLAVAVGTFALHQRQPQGPQNIAQAMGVPPEFLAGR